MSKCSITVTGIPCSLSIYGEVGIKMTDGGKGSLYVPYRGEDGKIHPEHLRCLEAHRYNQEITVTAPLWQPEKSAEKSAENQPKKKARKR